MDIKNIKSPLQFSGLRVSKFEFETSEFNEKNSDVEVEIQIDFDTKKYEESEDSLSAIFVFTTNAKVYSKSYNIFKLDFDIECKYHCSDITNFNKELFLNSIQFNGIINCSQFARNYMRSVLLLAGVQPIIDLPLLDPHEMINKKLKI